MLRLVFIIEFQIGEKTEKKLKILKTFDHLLIISYTGSILDFHTAFPVREKLHQFYGKTSDFKNLYVHDDEPLPG